MRTHVWSQTDTFPGKVNFIDSNNVLLGYDLCSCCCENASWTIGESKDGSNPIHWGDESESKEIDLPGYVFDPDFCERLDNNDNEQYVAIFKLVSRPPYGSPKKPDLYIRLENHQNGYYSHGFVFRGDVVIEGSI